MTKDNKKLTNMQMGILEVMKDKEPLCLFEISYLYGETIQPGTMNALVKRGYVVKSGERAIRCPECHSMRKYNEYVLKK